MQALIDSTRVCDDDKHDWPITNLATGEPFGLCWFCGMSAEAFKVATATAKGESQCKP